MPSKPLLSEGSVQKEESRLLDAYARRESLPKDLYSFLNYGNLASFQEREAHIISALRRYTVKMPLHAARLLEVGCGSGFWIREFIKWGVSPENAFGVDLLADAIAEAHRLSPPGVSFRRGNVINIEFPDESFDLVVQSMVFTSVLDPQLRICLAKEMLRVARRGGLIIWYDFHVNNPKNCDVQGIKKKKSFSSFLTAM